MRHRNKEAQFGRLDELDYIEDNTRWIEQLDLQKRDREGEINWLEENHRISAHLRSIHRDLSALANAFFAVGNEKIGDQLFLISTILEVEGRNVSTLAGMKVTSDLHSAQQGTADILAALVGGIKMGQADSTSEKSLDA